MSEIVWLRGLKPARIRAGLSQTQLAARLGVSRQAVCIWETGAKWPTPEKLPAIAEALGCSIDDLYTEPGAGDPSAPLRCAQDDNAGQDREAAE